MAHQEERRLKILAPRPLRVILAEEDLELRGRLGTNLRECGHEVVELAGGVQLLEYLSAVRAAPDLVLLDIRETGRSGLQVLEALRQSDWKMPVVLITKFGDFETYQDAFRLGASALFDKPFAVDDVRVVVLNLLQGS